MKNFPLFIFFALAAGNLIGVATGNETLVFSTKPLLMPMLAAWLMMRSRPRGPHSFFRGAVLGALAFSTLGDVLLMFAGGVFFLLGLFFFLLAHLFYIGAFASISNLKRGYLNQNRGWLLPFFAFPVMLLFWLWEGIPLGMKLPVSLYAGVITGMALSVLNMRGKLAESTFQSMMLGAVLFLLSDSLIALNMFGKPFEGARIAIMATYIAGQFLLVRGALEIITRSSHPSPPVQKPG